MCLQATSHAQGAYKEALSTASLKPLHPFPCLFDLSLSLSLSPPTPSFISLFIIFPASASSSFSFLPAKTVDRGGCEGVLLALGAMVKIGACASRGLRCYTNPNQPPPRNPPPPVVVNTPVPHPPPPHNHHGHPNATKPPPAPFRIIL